MKLDILAPPALSMKRDLGGACGGIEQCITLTHHHALERVANPLRMRLFNYFVGERSPPLRSLILTWMVDTARTHDAAWEAEHET